MQRHHRLALAFLLVAAPVSAQSRGTVEIGVVGKWTRFDKSFGNGSQTVTGWGAGVRLGMFLSRHWELELDDAQVFSHAKNFFKGFASTTLNYYPHHLRLDYNRKLGPAGRFSWMLGGGPAYTGYGKKAAGEPGFKGHDWGVAGLTGFRGRLSSALAFRVDAIVDYIPSPNNGKPEIVGQFAGINAAAAPGKNVDLGVQAGLAILLGHGR